MGVLLTEIGAMNAMLTALEGKTEHAFAYLAANRARIWTAPYSEAMAYVLQHGP